ncbi:hypothetical protein [Nonomuraea sp. NEAU-A123]|uniref:hypothetical protein n=1 Tax=Nonomuraea sp. NEAU-A123 TaxID=2839649 RepID=UPI001BE47782|nr:hypothetical protein [Nonomuraea sp. NEAU-A123]MBT2229868.1 hypothetical protein [Nonomuraea sp. NEAU-A123]
MSDYPEGDEDPRIVRQASRSGLDAVTCHEDLVRLLAEQFARADTSLRELQLRADKAGGTRLPRATCADMLAGRRFPKKALMVAFLRACRVPEHQLPAWERAWERVRVARMPAGTEPDPTPGYAAPATRTAGPSEAGPTSVPRRGWRQAAVSAALAALATAGGLSVIIDQRGASQGIASDGSGSPVSPGRIVSDDGRAFSAGGSSRFTATVDPANSGVRLIRRLDAGVARQYATITVNGDPAGTWRQLPGDSTYKWREQIVEIPRTLTAGRRSLTIVNTFVSSSLGFNEFLYVIEQKINGAWAIADTVDIGPDHTASEAAHDYHIVAQGWADTQTFTYPPREEDWRVE